MHALHVVGARPNFIKLAPMVAALDRRVDGIRQTIVHTGQHYDAMMSDVFFQELALAPPDHVLDVGSASHAIQTARIIERLEPVFHAERPDLVLVYGDVNSTLAAALVAAKLLVPVAHVEAGLRSFDRTMPEEINRVVADQCSDCLLVHSEDAVTNLRREGYAAERIAFVGNTMIDTLVRFEERIRNLDAARQLDLEAQAFLLVTLHRPALTDGPLLPEVIERLGTLSDMCVLFPVHPRTRRMLDGVGVPSNVRLTEPLGYFDFLSLQVDAAAVLTDSGGVQEETTYLGVPCFTLRANTERPVTIELGTNTLLGLDPRRISEIPALLQTRPNRSGPPPLWDGQAADRAADVLARGTVTN